MGTTYVNISSFFLRPKISFVSHFQTSPKIHSAFPSRFFLMFQSSINNFFPIYYFINFTSDSSTIYSRTGFLKYFRNSSMCYFFRKSSEIISESFREYFNFFPMSNSKMHLRVHSEVAQWILLKHFSFDCPRNSSMEIFRYSSRVSIRNCSKHSSKIFY